MQLRILLSCLALCSTAVASAQTLTSISDARKQDFGTTVVRVAGRVTAADQFRSTAYMQDKTAGIAVFNAPFRLGVQIGDSVIVDSATLTEFGQSTGSPGTGLTELAGTNMRFTVVPVERVPPTPRVTTVPLVGEGLEGSLIKIRRVKFVEKGLFQGETNYSVVDAQGNDISVRIDGATDIATNSLPIPETEVDLVGLLSQFRGGYQIFPRFAEDIGLSVEEDTVNKDRTMDISTWNLDWYGSSDTTLGPSDKDRQRRSIRQVMDSIKADVIAVQEVLSKEALSALSDSLDGSYGNVFAENIPTTQKLGYIYNTATITPVSDALAVNGGAQAWAGGRFPYRFTFDVTVDNVTRRMYLFNIHAKATDSATASEDYNRRKTDAETFHAYLHDFYADSAAIMIGDYNDALTKSVVDTTWASPYVSFVDDAVEWRSTTLPLEERGLASYIGGSRSFIDHVMLSNELHESHYRTYLEAPQAYLSSYSSTVSDHLPVTSRFWPTTVTAMNEQGVPSSGVELRVAPNPMVDRGTVELVVNQPSWIRLELIDAVGNTIQLINEKMTAQIRIVQLPVSQLASGTYRVVAYGQLGSEAVKAESAVKTVLVVVNR